MSIKNPSSLSGDKIYLLGMDLNDALRPSALTEYELDGLVPARESILAVAAKNTKVNTTACQTIM